MVGRRTHDLGSPYCAETRISHPDTESSRIFIRIEILVIYKDVTDIKNHIIINDKNIHKHKNKYLSVEREDW